MSKYTRTGGALFAVIGALAALPAIAPAQTTGAFARSTSTAGMSYSSTDASTTIRVSLSNTTFTIDDAVPIQAQEGCKAVAGDATQVTCTAFKESATKFKRFLVSARRGNDTVENNTTKTNGVGAPMQASGSDGDDTLIGADKVADNLGGQDGRDVIRGGNGNLGGERDELFGGGDDDKLFGGDRPDNLSGGTGNDALDGGDGGDRLNGGDGDDHIDGGLIGGGFHGDDTVSYATSSQPVNVDLNRDAPQGKAGENDTILRVENIEGSRLDDTLIGDHDPNKLFGIEGRDSLLGNRGIDMLSGGDGPDALFPSPVDVFGVLPDGKFDTMDCGEFFVSDDGDTSDLAFRVLADGDAADDCATVIDN